MSPTSLMKLKLTMANLELDGDQNTPGRPANVTKETALPFSEEAKSTASLRIAAIYYKIKSLAVLPYQPLHISTFRAFPSFTLIVPLGLNCRLSCCLGQPPLKLGMGPPLKVKVFRLQTSSASSSGNGCLSYKRSCRCSANQDASSQALAVSRLDQGMLSSQVTGKDNTTILARGIFREPPELLGLTPEKAYPRAAGRH